MSIHAKKVTLANGLTVMSGNRIRFRPYMVVFYILLTFFAAIVIVPLWWMVANSFETVKTYAFPNPPHFWPVKFTTKNYDLVMMNTQMIKYLKNSLIVTGMDVVFNLFVASMGGFVFSKGRFPGKTALLILILSSMMVPFETKLMPTYSIIQAWGLNNTYLGTVLPSSLTAAFNIFMIKKFCDSLPDALLEAATVDGASKFRAFLQIYLPLMGPIIATLTVLTVMNCWNDLLWPMIVMTKEEMYTVQVGMSILSNGDFGVHSGMICASSCLSILPLAVVFVFMQKYIVQSVAATGVKQ